MPTKSKLCAVIFDADGTLLDSMGFWTSTVIDLARSAGIDDADDELMEILNPMSMLEGAVYLRDHYGMKKPIEEVIAEENRRVLEFYTTRVSLLDRMGELVRRLYDENIPLAVATATDTPLIESALRFTGIYDYFKAVVSCGDVAHGKDEPHVFLRACELLGTLPENTLVADDSPTAIATAKAAGFPVIEVTQDTDTFGEVMRAFGLL